MKKVFICSFLALLFFCHVNLSISIFGCFLKVEFGNSPEISNQSNQVDSTMFFKDYVPYDTSSTFCNESQCEVKKIVSTKNYIQDTIKLVPNDKVATFIDENAQICISAWEKGVLPSAKMAQAIIESASGTSDICQKANNYFGIRCFVCDSTYLGYKIHKSKEHSFNHHNWVMKTDRFRHLLFNKSIEDWATQLQVCYYASDTNYTSAILYNIMLYDLYKLDEIAFSNPQKI